VRAWDGGAALQPSEGAPIILVPLDGSALAEAALPPAHRLARLVGGRLLLVRAVQVPLAVLEAAAVGGAAVDTGMVLDAVRDDAAAYLATQATTLSDGVAIDTAVEVGPAADVISGLARARRAGLIVMATHGHGVLHALFGGTAERVVRASPCPVAVIRTDVAAAGAAAA